MQFFKSALNKQTICIRCNSAISRKETFNTFPTRRLSSHASQQLYLDSRVFVDALHKDNDLADIDAEVDPHLEVATITRRVYERPAKAALFNNVKGAQNGLFLILGASGGLSNHPEFQYLPLARHIGLPRTANLRDIIDRMLSVKGTAPVPPLHVTSGPCKERIILGDDVYLTNLPVPLLNKADGGKYIQTLGINIVQHPSEPWTNWSIAPIMIHDKDRMAGLVIKPQHIARIHEQWKKAGKDVPYAIAS